MFVSPEISKLTTNNKKVFWREGYDLHSVGNILNWLLTGNFGSLKDVKKKVPLDFVVLRLQLGMQD